VERDGDLGGWLVLVLLVAGLIVVGAIALAQDGGDDGPARTTTTVETQTEPDPDAETETQPETETGGDETGATTTEPSA